MKKGSEPRQKAILRAGKQEVKKVESVETDAEEQELLTHSGWKVVESEETCGEYEFFTMYNNCSTVCIVNGSIRSDS